MTTGLILALDLATTVGWAIGRSRETPKYGHVKLSDGDSDIGDMGWHFSSWLEEKIAAFQISHIAFEPPYIPQKIRNMHTMNILIGLYFSTHTIARRYGITRLNPNTQQVTKLILGPQPPKGKKKPATMEAMWKIGFRPRTDDEADALALWCWAEQKIDKDARRSVGPLFTQS